MLARIIAAAFVFFAGTAFGTAFILRGDSGPHDDPNRVFVTPVNDGDFAPALLSLIHNANHSIRVCLYQARYYPNFPNSESNQLIDALGDAAQRGVAVTAVIDQSPWREDHDVYNFDTAARLADAGATVYIDPENKQSHQKLTILDDSVVFVGSANWSHFSLNENKEATVILWSPAAGDHYAGYFADRVAEATLWSSEAPSSATQTHTQPIAPEDLGFASFPAESIQYLDNDTYYPQLSGAIRNAQSNIVLVQNYAYYYDGVPPGAGQVPGRPPGMHAETDLLLDDLIDAQNRGVEVSAIFDWQWTDSFRKPWDPRTMAFAERLHAAGARVYRDDPIVQIHAKMLIIDDSVLVGSANWSFQGLVLNNETSVLVTARELVDEVYRDWVESLFDNGEPFTEPWPTE